MPETTADVVFVSAQYTGGTPEEIEYFLTKKIEEAVRGIEGIDEINSTSSNNSVSVRITLEMNYPYYDDAVTAIRDAVQRVDLPEDVEDEPRVHEVKSTNRSSFCQRRIVLRQRRGEHQRLHSPGSAFGL